MSKAKTGGGKALLDYVRACDDARTASARLSELLPQALAAGVVTATIPARKVEIVLLTKTSAASVTLPSWADSVATIVKGTVIHRNSKADDVALRIQGCGTYGLYDDAPTVLFHDTFTGKVRATSLEYLLSEGMVVDDV